jgi:carbamoyl-phosphate synthase small subunit
MPIARLALADGSIFTGDAWGATATRGGEVVFNTAHTGYQEVITDPSYCGQIICMTCPLQGNYGINPADDESPRSWIEGFAVRELANRRSNFRSTKDLEDVLHEAGVPGISGIDTRALTLRLRVSGAINGVLSSEDYSDAELLAKAKSLPSMAGQDLVSRVAPTASSEWTAGFDGIAAERARSLPINQHVVAIDCGMKRNILRHLVDMGCKVTIVPAKTRAAEIRQLKPDGVFISNGPGDPEPVAHVIETLRTLADDTPIFGICLGHQLLALALGAKTFKLKFGHHGYNHPVKNLLTGRVEITSQNHGFAVSEDSLRSAGLEQTHVNLYDSTVEGFRDRERPIFAVQYHPEAAPGPHDAGYLFDCFRQMLVSKAPPTMEQMLDAQASHAARRPRLAGVG